MVDLLNKKVTGLLNFNIKLYNELLNIEKIIFKEKDFIINFNYRVTMNIETIQITNQTKDMRRRERNIDDEDIERKFIDKVKYNYNNFWIETTNKNLEQIDDIFNENINIKLNSYEDIGLLLNNYLKTLKKCENLNEKTQLYILNKLKSNNEIIQIIMGSINEKLNEIQDNSNNFEKLNLFINFYNNLKSITYNNNVYSFNQFNNHFYQENQNQNLDININFTLNNNNKEEIINYVIYTQNFIKNYNNKNNKNNNILQKQQYNKQ